MLRRKDVPASKVGDTLKNAALILAGIWTIYLYFSEQKQIAQLAIAHGALENSRIALDNVTAERQRRLDEDGAFEIAYKIDADEKQPSDWREVWVTYDFKNNGKVPVTVYGVLIEWYIGELDGQALRRGLTTLNNPPTSLLEHEPARLVGDLLDNGPVKWTRVTANGCTRDLPLVEKWTKWGAQLRWSGCGLGEYKPSLGATYMDESIVTSSKLGVVGASIVVIYGTTGTQRIAYERLTQVLPRGRVEPPKTDRNASAKARSLN
jgi:hypothetical protein